MGNMKDIAKICRRFPGIVSHVLNGTAGVREPVRRRVLDEVKSTGYQPSQLAGAFAAYRQNVIGMIIPDISNPFFPAVVRGAEDHAFFNGYRLILCNTDIDHAKELAHLNELRTYLPAGLIVIPSTTWGYLDGCKQQRAERTAWGIQLKWASCRHGVPVIADFVSGVGHTWEGSITSRRDHEDGRPAALDFTAMAWRFFEGIHRAPGADDSLPETPKSWSRLQNDG